MKTLPFKKQNKKNSIGAIIRTGTRQTTGERTNTRSNQEEQLSDMSYLITEAPTPNPDNNNLLLIGGAALLLYFILK